jgi:hypothetical protein
MNNSVGNFGFWCGLAATAATVAYDVVQIMQIVGALHFPWDEILIYSTALCIVIPFVLEILAFHHITSIERQFWTHAALVFAVFYAVFVTSNYLVQLATVIPAKLSGELQKISLLDQTPHSLFWDFDAMGYICMGFTTLMLLPAVRRDGFERWVRYALLANVLVTPLIAVVYFYPNFTTQLLFIGFPWALTAPLSMLLLALLLRARQHA